MKNVVKKIVLSVMFALTMVFVAGVEVSAADTFPVKENMNVEAKEGAVFKIDLEAGGLSKETVYVVHSDTTTLKLTYKERSQGIAAFTSNVTVVKCTNVARGKCTTWKGYALESVDPDHLRSSGLAVKLNGFDGATAMTGVVNGTDLSDLYSDYYDITTMAFILVDYNAVETYWGIKDWKVGNHERIVAQYAQAIPVLNLQEANGQIVIKSDVSATQIDVTVESSVRVKTIKYIATTAQDVNFEDIASAKTTTLAKAFEDYATENGLTITDVTVTNDYLEEGVIYTDRKGSAFTTQTTITPEQDMRYYFFVEDEAGNQYVRDVANPGVGNQPVNPTPAPVGPTAPNTKVGKIILIVLVGILVVSAVLVIAQKIFDHKRKLY